MPRRATGQVVVDERRKSPTYALRFTANGRRQYVRLGSADQGMTLRQAHVELERELARVKLGTWTPAAPEPPIAEVDQDPSFHEFASRWFEAHRNEWRRSTQLDYEWQLSHHLLPFFRRHRLTQITIAEVDRYRAAKLQQSTEREKARQAWEQRLAGASADERSRTALVRERPPRPLSATSINKTITRLGQILEVAVEYGLIERNPARGKRRRLRAARPTPVWLDSAEQISALLDAAGELDGAAKANGQVPRRAILATLTFAGLRIGELIDLCWRDVNLADGRITIRASKTDAGVRTVDLLPALRDELATLKASIGPKSTAADCRVFPTQGDGPMNASNLRSRVLARAVERANERLSEAGATPLPEGLTPHKLRHTFASLLVALGTDPGAVMDQLGHTDPSFTLRVYRHGMRRDAEAKELLADLVGATKRQRKGSSDLEGDHGSISALSVDL